MKIGIISDIHGNKIALDAVLAELANCDVDEIVCLGDVVGLLGASNACIDTVRETCVHTIHGNHDSRFFPDRNWVPVRDVDIAEYEQVMDDISNENYEWLIDLPSTITAYGDVTLVHAKPGPDPDGRERENAGVFPRNFVELGSKHVDGGVLLLGHTHQQHAVNLDKYDGLSGLILNPGSVGFPFDKDAKVTTKFDQRKESINANPTGVASYAVVDTETQDYQLKSVEYDALPIQRHMEEWGFY